MCNAFIHNVIHSIYVLNHQCTICTYLYIFQFHFFFHKLIKQFIYWFLLLQVNMDASKVECHSDSDITSLVSLCKPEVITAEHGDGQVSERIVQFHSKFTFKTLISLRSFRNISFFCNFLFMCL